MPRDTVEKLRQQLAQERTQHQEELAAVRNDLANLAAQRELWKDEATRLKAVMVIVQAALEQAS
jgi:molybdopterin converting factor small subunit